MGNIRDYEELRDSCIADFRKVYKDSIVFDMNECSQEEILGIGSGGGR